MQLGMPEMIFIFLLALIIFGPKKLPEIGRQLGAALTEFKRASNEFKSQLEAEIRDLEIDQNTIMPPPTPPVPEGVIVHDSGGYGGAVQDAEIHNPDAGGMHNPDAASDNGASNQPLADSRLKDTHLENLHNKDQGYDA
jgi:TatA/E family protein of Tat protein translocase